MAQAIERQRNNKSVLPIVNQGQNRTVMNLPRFFQSESDSSQVILTKEQTNLRCFLCTYQGKQAQSCITYIP